MYFKHSKWLHDASVISVILQTDPEPVAEIQNSVSWKSLSVPAIGGTVTKLTLHIYK